VVTVVIAHVPEPVDGAHHYGDDKAHDRPACPHFISKPLSRRFRSARLVTLTADLSWKRSLTSVIEWPRQLRAGFGWAYPGTSATSTLITTLDLGARLLAATE
jgi:hypothetical protein